jgi:EAL domain-containing protein (putative c-di-GMP-specific phosphodiesterase class I)
LPLDDLLAALGAGRLQTRYQPVVRLSDGTPLGLEVLARLEHPALGTLPPDRFVPRIEAAGFATRLARVVVRRAFAEWSGDALPELGVRLGVNLPLDVLLLPGTADRLETWREEAGIRPGRITVELTETHPVVQPDLLRPVLTRLREAGYGLAIDDVGPAMRDHEDLFALPFTAMKLDKDVVHASADSAVALRFVERATAVARRSGLLVIAEGIKTAADWARMERLGVDAAQGFLIARPLTAVATVIWHAAWSRRRAA